MSLPSFSEHTVRSLSTQASFLKGKRYLYDNAVGVVESDGTRYWAKVQGTRPYRVTVYERNGELHAECTCPYNFGGICKHSVATMLKIIEEGPKWAKIPGLSPSEMIKRMNKTELESFVMDLVGLKDGILDMLQVYYLGERGSRATVADYLSRVEDAFRDKDLSIYNNRNVYEKLQPIESLAEKLRVKGNYREAAKVYEALFEGVAKNIHRVEDSYGLFGEIAGYSLDSLTECLIKGEVADSQKRRYVQKFLKSYERVCYEFFNDNYKEAILKLATPDDLENALGKLDKLIADYAASEEDEWPAIYYYRHAVLFKLDILDRLARDEDFIRLAKANCDTADVCLKLAEKLKANNGTSTAVEVAESSLSSFRGTEAEGLNRFLAEVYTDTSEYEKAVDKYSGLFLTLGDFNYYERLRELAMKAGMWPKVLNQVVSSLSRGNASADLLLSEVYLRERMYEDAIGVAHASSNLTVLEMVAEAVKETYPMEAYDLYRRLVDIYLEENIGRAAYKQAASFLQRMKDIGFEREFSSYIDELNNRFKRRRALKDEIMRKA